MERGHAATIVTNENFRAFVEGFGVSYLPITADTEKLINSPEALKILEGGSIFKFFYHIQKVSAETADQANRDILYACTTFDHIITSVLPLPVVYSIAEKYGKKLAVVFLSVPPVPTREFPFQVFGTTGHPWLNRLSYKLTGLAYLMIRKKMNEFRKVIGLQPANVMRALLRSNTLAMTAISQLLLPQPKDWPSNAHVTGFLFLSPTARKKPGLEEIPDGLEAWLANGDIPIYMGFGSIPIPDQARLIPALQGLLAERRVVFAAGWSVVNDLPAHPNLYVVQYVNHDWLLPRCSAAIIHGGIGTIAAVLRSGIPVIVVSILADQPINGQLIEQKRLGFHIPFKQLSSQKLLQAVHAADNPLIRANGAAAAKTINAEDGVQKAVELIEKYFQ
jgi:UDP:flavonoid glycosyltransferase YjiC (YdhE family)